MKKWSVTGTAELYIRVVVEADTEEDALEMADEVFGGIVQFAGNGGTDKLVGVMGTNESCECDDSVDWSDAEELEDA